MEQMNSILDSFLSKALALLPDSPFEPFLEEFEDLPFLNFLNWFVPVGQILGVLTAWGVAILLFYAITILLRWAKVIQ